MVRVQRDVRSRGLSGWRPRQKAEHGGLRDAGLGPSHPADAPRYTARLVPGLTTLRDSGAWPNGDLAFDYFCACEAITPSACQHGGVVVERDGRPVAIAPTFTAALPLDIILSGPLKSLAVSVSQRFPKLTSLRLIALGQPYWNRSGIAFSPDLEPASRAVCVQAMLKALEDHARQNRFLFTIVKDVSDIEVDAFGSAFAARRFSKIAVLPQTTLAVPPTNADYIDSLSANMRSNMRRKLKKAAGLTIETLTSLDGIETEIVGMKKETAARANVDFDLFSSVPPTYFRTVLEQMPGRAIIRLYRLGGKPIGFALMVADGMEIIETFTGMHYPAGPENGLFFRNWMEHLDDARLRGMSHIETGPTTYLTKQRLNCAFHRSWLYVRAVNPALNRITRWGAPRLGLDQDDPELKNMGDLAPYGPEPPRPRPARSERARPKS